MLGQIHLTHASLAESLDDLISATNELTDEVGLADKQRRPVVRAEPDSGGESLSALGADVLGHACEPIPRTMEGKPPC
jgi:hypothetical protein